MTAATFTPTRALSPPRILMHLLLYITNPLASGHLAGHSLVDSSIRVGMLSIDIV